MPLKKQPLNDNEIPIYDEALIYQRGEYWQMRMWLGKESKYARFSLRTRKVNSKVEWIHNVITEICYEGCRYKDKS